MSDPYCYPESTVLQNKFGIQDQALLVKVEKRLTALRLVELWQHPMKGTFNLQHLCKIHNYIFQDLYDWAGELRIVDIAKGNLFCKTEYLQAEANQVFGELEKDFAHISLDSETVCQKLAYYLSEINALHPFREGNGRAQREFIRELALSIGYDIDFTQIGKREMVNASKAGFLCNYDPMENLMKRNLKKK